MDNREMEKGQGEDKTDLARAGGEIIRFVWPSITATVAQAFFRLFSFFAKPIGRWLRQRPIWVVLFAAVICVLSLALVNREKVDHIRREIQHEPYVTSTSFRTRRDGARIFESDKTPMYRHAEKSDGFGGDYTPYGLVLQPKRPTLVNPVRASNRVTLDSNKAILVSIAFLKEVSRGQFQLAVGAGPDSAVTLQIAPDPFSKTVYLSVKQQDHYLPDMTSEAKPSMKPDKGLVVPLQPKGEEFWILVRLTEDSLSVELPSPGHSELLVYELRGEPELNVSTTIERRSYGSDVLLKHMAIGTPEVLRSIVNGQFEHDGWPDLTLGDLPPADAASR